MSYIKYWDVNNLYEWAMSRKISENYFQWVEEISEFYESFIKIYNEESNERYLLEVDIKYLKKLQNLRNYLPFLTERIKIQKVEKLVGNLHDKTEYIIHTIILKQALNYWLLLKKVHIIIKFNQKIWLKP